MTMPPVSMDTPDPRRGTVWFDGGCPLCRREIAWMQRLNWRRRIHFVDLISAEDASCPLDRGELLARFHAREGGRLLDGAAAFAAMWRAIPLFWPLGQLARLPPALTLLEAAYVRFLRWRARWR
jgi:predicted DCC family thiol-disulfide oxidoreductase YuxK